MKKILLALVFVLASTTSFARQYIQCGTSHSWDRFVINLDGDNSTFFYTNGAHQDDEIRIIKKLIAIDTNIFQTVDNEIVEVVTVPKEVLGKASDYFNVHLSVTRLSDSYNIEMSLVCFSSIHD